MKALVYTAPESLEFRAVADPVPANDEVLVQVDSVGICGSDMHAYLGHDERRPAPLILGHEVAGKVVGGTQDGRRVTINPLVACGYCPACKSGRDNLCPKRQIISMPPREGGFAQYLAMREANLVTVPDAFPLDKASMAEPIACGWHAARLANSATGGITEDTNTLVLGGGAIGVGAALSLLAFGIRRVTVIETNKQRRDFLREATGLKVIDATELAPDAQFDVVVDGVGFAATRATASRAARPGGVIMHIGLGAAEGGLDIRRVTLQEITFIGTYTYTSEDFRATADAMFSGKLGSLDWFETRPLADGKTAFAEIRKGSVKSPKIILKP